MKLKYAEFREFGPVGQTGILFLDKPPLNIFNQEMCEELTGCLKKLALDTGMIERLVITAKGDNFSAGADIDEHFPGKVETMLPKFHELLLTIASFPIPTIAVVSGNCLGGGLEVARACSWVVALNPHLKEIKLGVPEIKLGCFPPFALALFPRLSGDLEATIRFLLTGQILSFSDKDPVFEPACQMGLVNETFRGTLEEYLLDFEEMPRHELQNMARFFREMDFLLPTRTVSEILAGEAETNNINSLSCHALTRAVKALVVCAQAGSLKSALAEAERIYLKKVVSHPDYLEGLKAFKEKRKPVWQEIGFIALE